MARLAIMASLLLAACGGTETSPDAGPSDSGSPDAGPPDGSPPDTGPVLCGTGNRPLPEGLVELGSDDGTASSHVGEQTWAVELTAGSYPLRDEVAHEAVRFELDRPARIHGFAVQWGGLPADGDPSAELEAGLYADFGYNGFDMWRWEPLWSGTRCLGDVEPGTFVQYVFDAPIDVPQPGLVYVGHERPGTGAHGFLFDGSRNECADSFDACHSSINLHDFMAGTTFNGMTLQIPYDYVVRLYVEYTAELAPEDRLFQIVPGVTPGSRASFGDYDDDGWDDFVTNGPRLWRNLGDGTLADVTAASGIAGLGISGGGGVWGDYDNDGCLDLFVFSESLTAPDSLLRSMCDGTFEDATATSGIADSQSYEDCGDPANVRSPSAAAAWVDLDADGFIDLYVSNYICTRGTAETYYVDTVFHNEGDGTFTDWTATHGFSSARTASRGAVPADFDGDGDMDLLVNNYRLQANFLFENQGDGTFREVAPERGLAGHPDRQGTNIWYGHTIGAAWGDLDGDGDLDAIEANLAHPRFYGFSDKTRVLLNDGTAHFGDITGDWTTPRSEAGLRYQETHSSPVLADFDQNGTLDLVITAVYDGRPTDFYWGDGDGTFTLDVFRAGITTENGWGAAVGDIDHDGDLDLIASALYENTIGPPEVGHFLQVRPVGNVRSNRAALGATVTVVAPGRTLVRHVQGGSGQGCQDSQSLHFGLGEATSVPSIEVRFPGSAPVTFTGPFAADQRVWVFEDGSTHLGWAPRP